MILSFLFPKKKTLDLEEYTQFIFVKDDYGRYEMQFFNPLKGKTWALPDLSAAIHAPWSFEKRGSYGAYGLHSFKCKMSEISSVKVRFEKLKNIQNHFDIMNKRYKEFREEQERRNNQPKIIN